MVTRNQCDGGGPADWWQGLPARVRRRVSARPAEPVGQLLLGPPRASDPPAPPSPAAQIVVDLARMTAALLAVWVALVAVLLIALSFLSGGPLPVPGR